MRQRICFHRTRHMGRSHAFTLIEALFAMAMIAVLLPVVMEGISVAISLSSQARREAEAANLARSKLDELVATTQWNGGASLSGTFDPDHPGYQWSATTRDWQSGTMTELDVQVTWTARQHPQSITMSTLVTFPSDRTTQ